MSNIQYADDLAVGQRIEFGQHTVSQEEIVEYAKLWDPLFIHADPVAAELSPFGSVIASGIHTLAIYQRLAVQAFWSGFKGGIGRGFEINFRRPVLPGNTLSGHLLVESVTPRPERNDATVTLSAKLVNEDADVVLELINRSVLPLSPGRS
ncbi:hypothetical protein CH293_26355 [Rhodococcus sp. 14-2470-1b]|uniref:MaoC/PaaZ C-terminal domain-containing protein n=1 Tax=Rhodococcus sp. 14-2470-1b TaxID=2023149 RepID=UPI000B9A80F8|nr:MaoC/PaaZ C-terminal domain-containing protein [Rhodococcus sp. 14-2470-1b]OZF42257.1 hypothetical protein CH293_26355 [Rhodococcus sp. 14-2470-1b]